MTEICENCGRTYENHHSNDSRSCKWKYSDWKPKNQSPQKKPIGCSLRTPEDTPDVSVGLIPMSSGSFDLSRFIKKNKGSRLYGDIGENHVKEFIKRLKEDLDTKPHWTKENYEYMIRRQLSKIDALAGEKLR